MTYFLDIIAISLSLVNHVKSDLANPDSVVKVIEEIKPDVIIHSAALMDVDECETEKELAYKINVEGTKVIAEMARMVVHF